MEHETLQKELPNLQQMSVEDRIALAKKRRKGQLRRYWNRESDEANSPPFKTSKSKVHFTTEVNIFDAVDENNIQALKTLIRDQNLNIQNHDGLTPLHLSCIEGHLEIARFLLQKGSKVNAKDGDGWTPLHAAATCGHKHIVELLVNSGANLTATNTDGNMAFEITEDEYILTFLEEEMANQGITREYIQDKQSSSYKSLKEDVIKAIIEQTDLDIPLNPEAVTYLHVAVANFYNDIVKLLINNGASDDVVDDEGWLPIHAAAYWGNNEAFDILAKKSHTNINAKTNEGLTPYELSDDPDFKIYISELQNNHLTLQAERKTKYFMDLESEETDEVDRLRSRRRSSDCIPLSINPFINLDEYNKISTKRITFKEAKKYAPNIKAQNINQLKNLSFIGSKKVRLRYTSENSQDQCFKSNTDDISTEYANINQRINDKNLKLEHVNDNSIQNLENLSKEEIQKLNESNIHLTNNLEKDSKVETEKLNVSIKKKLKNSKKIKKSNSKSNKSKKQKTRKSSKENAEKQITDDNIDPSSEVQTKPKVLKSIILTKSASTYSPKESPSQFKESIMPLTVSQSDNTNINHRQKASWSNKKQSKKEKNIHNKNDNLQKKKKKNCTIL